jgi:membrane associated rhomboid family serine protease
MITASVGFHCPQCARQGRQQVYTARDIRNGSDPIVTKVLVGINLAVFLLTAFGGGSVFSLRFDALVDYSTLGFGIDPSGTPIGVEQGEWYRLVTGGFLHANLIHIGFNMYLLWLLGQVLEPAFGRLRFGLLYGVSLLAGSFGAILLSPTAPTVGASGAVFGLMGAMVIAQRAAGIDVWRSGIGGLVAVNLLLTFAISNISIGGHLGGLIGGTIAALCLIELPSRLSTNRRDGLIVGTVLVAAIGIACVAGAGWAADNWADPLFPDGFLQLD